MLWSFEIGWRVEFLPIASIFAISVILVFLTFSGGMDLSALGRVKQYLNAYTLFLSNPFGYGFGYAGFPKGIVSFDCSILVILVNFGIFGIIILLFLYKTILIKNKNNDYSLRLLIINFFILSGFVNIIHLGILTLCILNYRIVKYLEETNVQKI